MTRTVKLNSVRGLQQKEKKKKRVWTSQLVPEWLTVVLCFIISGWMYHMAHIFNPQWAYPTSVRSNCVVCAVAAVFNRENVIYWSKCWRNEEEKIAFWLMVSFAWQLLADWIENQSCWCSSMNACKWAFQSALITYVKKDFTACESHFSFSFLFLLAGQIQEVSLGQDEAVAQVEVTPELDLEVVPESSGDWHNVFHWPTAHHTSQTALYGALSTDQVLQLNRKALPNISSSPEGLFGWRHDRVGPRYSMSRAFTLIAVPCCLSELAVKYGESGSLWLA